MALTAPQAAVGLRLVTAEADYATFPGKPTVDRLLTVSVALVKQHALDAPDDVKDEATLRLIGWLYDSGRFEAGEFGERPAVNSAGALVKSGTASLLKPWRAHRAGACDG